MGKRREDVLIASTFSTRGSKLKSLFLLLDGAHGLEREVVRWREAHYVPIRPIFLKGGKIDFFV